MARKEKRIVVDTNVLISSLINPNSVVWNIIDVEEIDFLVPELVIYEVEKYEKLIKKKIKLKGRKEAYEYLLSELFTKVIIVPAIYYQKHIEEAYEIMGVIDEKDTEFLALAIAYKCSIWSDDKDFLKQDRVTIYTSKEIIEKMIADD